jgi:hypothetical protein
VSLVFRAPLFCCKRQGRFLAGRDPHSRVGRNPGRSRAAFIHRDCHIRDWVAGTTAVAAALVPMMLDGRRRFSLGAQP